MTPRSLLPATRDDEDPSPDSQLGFVDDAVIARLLSQAGASRVGTSPEDLVLAADDMDFAGWRLAPGPSVFRGTEDNVEVPPLSFRRATPPAIHQAGIDVPQGAIHRWWLAGLAGVLATLIITLLLLILSSRPEPGSDSIPTTPAVSTTDSRR
jgi:hypothetical protein